MRETMPRRQGIFEYLAGVACWRCLLLVALAGWWCDVRAADGPADDFSLPLFDDALRNGFEDWSWTASNPADSDLPFRGRFALSATMKPDGGLYLANPATVRIPSRGTLRFMLHANDTGAITVSLLDANGAPSNAGVTVNPVAGEWRSIAIPLERLGSSGTTSGVWWQDATGSYRARLYLDDIVITGDAPPAPEDGIVVRVNTGAATLRREIVNPSSGRSSTRVVSFPRDIDDKIYGVNFAPDSLREELGVRVNRWGGNHTERYNFRTSSTNQGQDYYFTNNPMAEGAHHRFERDNQADGTESLITIPSMGWVSSGRTGTCSYPVSRYGEQDEAVAHWQPPRTICGNGLVEKRKLPPADPSPTSIAVDERFATEWVREMVATHGTAAEGGVEMYAIGNEPGLWYSTHRDLAGAPTTRAELIDRDLRYAAAIKRADATAEVLGPVLWGGSSYYVSSDERDSGLRSTDVPMFVADYLVALRDAERRGGRRLLDKLAVNFYDDRVYREKGLDTLRLESTRQLWDPSYAPSEWWVARDFLNGQGSAVIPRLKTAIDENYPGTELAITEYNFGDVDGVSGALAQVDALGIFGREGLDMATLWEPYASWVDMPEADFVDRPVFWAFRLYRNYDGRGGRFGDEALLTSSTDEGTVSSYAARRDDGALTVVMINKSLAEQRVELRGIGGGAEGYRYGRSSPRAIATLGDVDLSSGQLALPARSATLLVVGGR